MKRRKGNKSFPQKDCMIQIRTLTVIYEYYYVPSWSGLVRICGNFCNKAALFSTCNTAIKPLSYRKFSKYVRQAITLAVLHYDLPQTHSPPTRLCHWFLIYIHYHSLWCGQCDLDHLIPECLLEGSQLPGSDLCMLSMYSFRGWGLSDTTGNVPGRGRRNTAPGRCPPLSVIPDQCLRCVQLKSSGTPWFDQAWPMYVEL